MKLEPELVREILQFAEDIPAGEYRDMPAIGERDWVVVACHASIMHTEGYLSGSIVIDHNGLPACCRLTGLNWKGHQLLRLSKKDDAWNVAKEHFKKKAIVMTIDLLFEYLEAYFRSKMQMP